MKKCNLKNENGRSLLVDGGLDAPQYGRSMIEMLGALAIIGVLSVGGIAGYSKAMHKYRVNKAISQITQISQNIHTFFHSQKNYGEVTCYSDDDGCCKFNGCPIIRKAKIIPDEMLTLSDNGTKIIAITNPFGYRVDLLSTLNDNGFYMRYFLMDNLEVCIELLIHDWSASGVKAILLNGDVRGYLKTPVDIALSTEACNRVIDRGLSRNDPFYINFYFDTDLNKAPQNSWHFYN